MRTSSSSDPSEARYPVYVWDLLVRVTHWTIALSIVTLAITGIYIGDPYRLVPDPAGQHFVMGSMKLAHFYAAIAFTLAFLSRLVWLFFGPGCARWKQFLPVQKRRLKGIFSTLKFYLFISKEPPLALGHNPLAGLAYTVLFLLYLLMIGTGLGLYGMSASGPMSAFGALLEIFGGAQTARWLHHVVMWLILAFVTHHIASAILVARVEKTGTMDSIFSGYKYMRPDDVERCKP